MDSMAFDWDASAVRQTQSGHVRQFIDMPTAMVEQLRVHATTVNPGQPSHAPHDHSDEELIIVKEGEITVLMNDAERTVSAGAMVFLAAGQWHGIRNVSQSPATYFVVRWRT